MDGYIVTLQYRNYTIPSQYTVLTTWKNSMHGFAYWLMYSYTWTVYSTYPKVFFKKLYIKCILKSMLYTAFLLGNILLKCTLQTTVIEIQYSTYYSCFFPLYEYSS